jgi:glyoxylase-like metal-dependent hydrolase (beta-lactamase superfamily II)
MENKVKITENIYQMQIPIPDNPLEMINSYLIKTNEGSILVDTGWNTDEAFTSLCSQMKSHGVSFSDLKYIFMSHIHPDHYGLVGRIEKFTDAKLIIHEHDKAILNSRYIQTDNLVDEMTEWLKFNGVPEAEQTSFSHASLKMLGYVDVALPDIIVSGGEKISLGDNTFEVIWSPGHSPGHICFFEEKKRLLIAGDHILEKISPNISMNNPTTNNPLVDYMNSLEEMKKLDVEFVLPGHGRVFSNYRERIDQLLIHHEKRLLEMLTYFEKGPATAYQIAIDTKWYLPWDDLPMFSKRVAVTETLAHLELLIDRCALSKKEQAGIIYYFLPE